MLFWYERRPRHGTVNLLLSFGLDQGCCSHHPVILIISFLLSPPLKTLNDEPPTRTGSNTIGIALLLFLPFLPQYSRHFSPPLSHKCSNQIISGHDFKLIEIGAERMKANNACIPTHTHEGEGRRKHNGININVDISLTLHNSRHAFLFSHLQTSPPWFPVEAIHLHEFICKHVFFLQLSCSFQLSFAVSKRVCHDTSD